MEKWESYFHQPKSIKELIKTATFVVDTNVLLSAYQWRDLTVKEMTKTLKRLSDEGRLRIPLQVLKEFSKNRPKEIVQRINDLETLLSTFQTPKPLNQIVPILEGSENYLKTLEYQKSYKESLNEYKEGLIKLRDDLKDLFIHDPYLIELEGILKKSLYIPEDVKSDEELTKEAELRFKLKTPPGYKDSPKDENSTGDYIIWSKLLSLKTDAIFVSGDKKQDWVYSDKQNNSVGARRELVEEFYIETKGKDFAHLSPKEFITLLNPGVSIDIIQDLSSSSLTVTAEIMKTDIELLNLLLRTINRFDPMEILENNDPQGKYVIYIDLAEQIMINVLSGVDLKTLRRNLEHLVYFVIPTFKSNVNIQEMINELYTDLLTYRTLEDFNNGL
ncbi:PIN-like domain-containing protein [Psychrobacillus psychrodurans]|uniref:PIN-like domain-containing protein n=1 Tax=Psychrobacillus psychrodurans TaxID=126157 RepID=UPI003D03E461